MSTSLLNRSRVRGEFYRALSMDARLQIISLISLMTSSDSASERYAFLMDPPKADLWNGPRKDKKLAAITQDVINEKWESSIEIPSDDLRRDQTGDLRRRMGMLAGRMAEIPWRLISDRLRLGNTAAVQGYDGVNYFAATHELGDSGAQTNLITSTEVSSLNVATATAPTPEEFVDALMGCIARFFGMLDSEGEPMWEDARNFVAIVPVNLWDRAVTAVKANHLASGETNIVPVLSADGFNVRVQVNNRAFATPLAADHMFLINVDGPTNPAFIFQTEQAPELNMLDESSDHFFDTDNFKVGGKANLQVATGEPLRALRCTFS